LGRLFSHVIHDIGMSQRVEFAEGRGGSDCHIQDASTANDTQRIEGETCGINSGRRQQIQGDLGGSDEEYQSASDEDGHYRKSVIKFCGFGSLGSLRRAGLSSYAKYFHGVGSRR
jgi:hypothetical protein